MAMMFPLSMSPSVVVQEICVPRGRLAARDKGDLFNTSAIFNLSKSGRCGLKINDHCQQGKGSVGRFGVHDIEIQKRAHSFT